VGHDPCLTQSFTFFNREGIGVVAVMARAPVARLRELVARHAQFSVALAAGAVLRLVAMLGYPGALWFAGDSYLYVGAALRPTPNQSKTTGYSLFLRALLPFHSFTLVTGLQHLMGLGIAVMVYVLARRAGVSKLWATAATLPVLLDGFEIEDEHMVMAEALFTFLILLAMLLILWRSRTSWVTALIAGLLVGYAVVVRSEGLPLLVLFPAYLLWRGRRSWRGWLVAAVMAIACAAPVLAYATWFDHEQGSFTLSRADGFYLWGRVSSFADCSVIKPPADELQICPTGSPSSRTAPGDYIWHFGPVHNIAGGPVSVANDRLLRDFAIRAIEAQPFGYATAVIKGLMLSVEWPRHKYPDAGTVGYYYFRLQTQSIPDNPNHEWVRGGTAYQDVVSYGHASPSRVVEPFASMIILSQRILYTYGPLFGLILVMGLGGLVRIEGLRERRPRLAWSRRAGSMLPWVTGVVLLVFPIATTDFDYRYLLPVLPFASLAAGLAFAPARVRSAPQPPAPHTPVPQRDDEPKDDLTTQVPGPVS
jgi:Dolichyl-phosphate-mannose-protein mannosyltransferase